MKRNHTFDLSILALAVILALIIYSYSGIFSTCVPKITPYVTTSISAETLSASTGTKLPLQVSLINEGSQQISGGSIVIGVFHEDTDTLIYSGVAKSDISLNSNETATTSVFWDIPSSIYGSVYRIKGFFVVDGYALKGRRVLTDTPFGNTAKIYVSGEENGSIPTPSNGLPQNADYSSDSACTDSYELLPAWAMAIGGIGTLMLILLIRRKKNHTDISGNSLGNSNNLS